MAAAATRPAAGIYVQLATHAPVRPHDAMPFQASNTITSAQTAKGIPNESSRRVNVPLPPTPRLNCMNVEPESKLDAMVACCRGEVLSGDLFSRSLNA